MNDPTGKWGLEKIRDGQVGTLTDPIAIEILDQDGEVFDGVTFDDVQANTEAVTIAGEEFGIGEAVLFTKVAEANLGTANLIARLYYNTTGDLYETTDHPVKLRPIPSRSLEAG